MDRANRPPRTVHATLFTVALALLALVAWSAPARAQSELYTFSAGLLGTVGGAQDVNPGDDLGNAGFQIDLSMITQPGEHLVLRIGNLGLGNGDQFGPDLTNAEMTYATIGGEYRYRHSYYDSGVFLALGGYRLGGDDLFTGESQNHTAIGLSAGASGEFPINPWMGVAVELTGHYVDFDEAQIFLIGGAGLVFHF